MAAIPSDRMDSGDGSARSKSERMKKQAAVKEIQQLRLKISALERDISLHLFGQHSPFYQQHGHLQELGHKAEEERKAERSKSIQQISKIKTMVGSFTREVRNVRPTPEFVEKLKNIMEDIESQISNFKEQQKIKYEEIMREELIASQEITALERRMETWSQQAQPSAAPNAKSAAPLSSHRDITKDLPPEVAAFERFVQQTGGPRGGWDEYDHGMFLKYRNRHKGKASFLEELRGYVPTKTVAELQEHENWYLQYLRLQDKKKEAIQAWKVRKENEKARGADSDSSSDSEDEGRAQQEKRMQVIERERYQRRAQLNAWKVEKELEKAAAEEQRLRAEMDKAHRLENEKKRQAALREQVEEFRHQKQLEEERRAAEESMQSQAEREEKRKEATVIISRFQNRDQAKLSEKLSQKREKLKLQQEKKEKLQQLRSQVAVNIERDPSRLLQPTKGWMERQKEPGPSSSGQVYHLPHRAVPTWRQGMF